ncbi:CRYZ [Symbiodinium sp. CCMP2456]|nr:CRYZ [Symbiodinium sp. CCMP2456]
MDGLRSLLQQAGYSTGDVQTHLDYLDGRGIQCVRDLREQLQEGTGLDELGFPATSFRRKLNLLITKQRMIEHSWNDIQIAHSLSQVAYQTKNDQVFHDFDRKFQPLFLDLLECRATKQRYAIAVVQRQRSTPSCFDAEAQAQRALYVAFAGTRNYDDWKTNSSAVHRPDTDVGGLVHAGFSRRARQVRFHGLKRIATAYECQAVVFAGHSLGGAVAHLAALQALNLRLFGETMKVLSVGIGAPMCAAPGLVRDMRIEQWTSKFLTIANDEDPVPALLNIADTLQQFGRDAEALGNGVCASVFELLSALPLGDGIPQLAGAVGRVISAMSSLESYQGVQSILQKLQLAYMPLGMYFILKNLEETRSVEVHEGQDCKDILGGARLLTSTSVLNHEGLIQHGLAKYWHAVNSPELQSKCPVSGKLTGRGEVKVSSIEFGIETAQIEAHNGELTLHLVGDGLDFVAPSAVKMADIPDLIWKVVHCSKASLVLRAAFTGQQAPAQAHVTVWPDVCSEGTRVVAQRLATTLPEASANQYEFSENFFKAMMKSAWTQKLVLRTSDEDNTVLQALQRVDKLAGPDLLYDVMNENEQPRLRTFDQCIAQVKNPRRLHEVGEGRDSEAHVEHVLQWLCPEQGHVLLTGQQIAGKVGIAAAATLVCIAIVASGGLGLVGAALGYSGSLTGGWGTATLIATASATGIHLLRSKVSGRYQELLREMHTWTGARTALQGNDEYEMETALIVKVNDRKRRDQASFPGPWHGHATKQSQELLEQLYEAVVEIHRMKKAGRDLKVVAILGPQKSGKYLLASQLMMDTKLAVESDVSKNTRECPPHAFTSRVALIDAPGLTSTEACLQSAYYNGPHSVSSVFLYIRPFTNTAESFDAETIYKVLMTSNLKSPSLLICLNKAKTLQRDGKAGRYYDAQTLRTLRDDFLRRVREDARQKATNSSGFAAFWADRFDARFAAKWNNVEIVFSDLGTGFLPGDVPEGLKKFMQDEREVWNASGIGKWVRQALGGQDPDLDKRVEAINRDVWQQMFNA